MTRYIQRHSLLTRVTHGVAAVACILLAVTGVFILVPLFAVLKSPAGFVHLFKEDIFGKWDKDDVTWAMKFPFYLFAPGKVHMPPQHHVKSAQRLADGALLFFCIMLALSGIVLWLNTGFPTGSGLKVDFAPETLLLAHLVHDVFFFLTVFVGIAHIYLGAGIFQPYRGTARIMFGDGKVSESDAVYHWGYWANEEIALGKNVTVEKDGKEK